MFDGNGHQVLGGVSNQAKPYALDMTIELSNAVPERGNSLGAARQANVLGLPRVLWHLIVSYPLWQRRFALVSSMPNSESGPIAKACLR